MAAFAFVPSQVTTARTRPYGSAPIWLSSSSTRVSFPKQSSLGIVQIKNAAGTFVSPTAEAVSAALATATVNPDLTLKINYTPDDQLRHISRWAYAVKHDGVFATGVGALGLHMDLNRVSDDNYWRDFSRTSSRTRSGCESISIKYCFKSCPAQKLSPAPVMMITRVSLS